MYGPLTDADFVPLSMDRRDEYSALFAASAQKASDYSFVNIWGWSEERRYEWAFRDGLCWLRLTNVSPPEYWAPVGNWDRDWSSALEGLFPNGAAFSRVPEVLADMWRGIQSVELEEQRSQWEYLYDRDRLVSLSGNLMHKKKNLLAQFQKLYDYRYDPICPARLGDIRALQAEWLAWRGGDESPGLAAENTAVARVLDKWEELDGLLGGCISVKDEASGERKIIAYTIAEDLGDGSVVIHFEKGIDSYKGVYQAINQMFLANAPQFTTVNREQDMGSEGIRRAKESYHPTGFLKKYQVRFTGPAGTAGAAN
ncbi:MAG: phosphatidylglycerol lysyltransferase domain-containing protein [Synergistaceae bacterium]|jgi:hypothetical protein|nr:phosphatidylglycerol lysyltransferase domain-containing protein [Synergistaceae bacterium]